MNAETITRPQMTLADFLPLPEDETSPVKYELEFGELVGMTRPAWEHNELTIALAAQIQHRDIGIKKRIYRACGVQWYWVVDMEGKIVEEYRWTEEGYFPAQVVLPKEVFQPKAFPGLTIDLQGLFEVEEKEVSPREVK